MPKPKRREQEQAQENQQRWQSAWDDIVRRVAQIERVVGNSVLHSHPDRDSMEAVGFRLAFLSGYIESRFERAQHNRHNARARAGRWHL